ncbi:hypothetical protein JQM63_03680 [Oscillibacter valericigenes]|nr:hypothetical protein [Oscillibacter valericigenes]
MSQISLEKIRKPLSRKAFTLCLHFSRKFRIQAPFSNITPDWMVPTDLSSQPCIVGGKSMDFTCGDCQAEMAFIEVMTEGDADDRGFRYPIPTQPPFSLL